MVKRYIILSGLLGCIQFGFSQQDKLLFIEYIYSNSVYSNEEFLIATAEFSLYENTALNKTEKDTLVTENGEKMSMGSKKINLKPMFFFKDHKKNLVFIKSPGYHGNGVFLNDQLDAFSWNLNYKETKLIADFLCNKATVNFRGRSYIVYYSLQLPVGAGPYKFMGLPGAILEIESTTAGEKHKWVATKIVYPYIIQEQLKPSWVSNNTNFIDFKTYTLEKDKFLDYLFSAYDARQSDRNVSTRTVRTRKGIEKIYEWELKEDKN